MDKSPADIVIEKFGGHRVVAEILDLDLSRVYRWTYAPENGGTGGTIPQKHQIPLMDAARERGIDLSPADFFPAQAIAPSQEASAA